MGLIASTHLAVGALGGIIIQKHLPGYFNGKLRIASAIAIGIISHIVLDAFPHWEYSQEWPWLLLIVETMLVFSLVLSSRQARIVNLVIMGGMFGGAFPDLLTRFAIEPMLSLNHLLHMSHGDLQIIGHPISLFIQLIITLLAMIFVRYRST